MTAKKMTAKLWAEKMHGKTVVVTASGVADARRLEEVLVQSGVTCIASSPRKADTDAVYVSETSFFWFNSQYDDFARYEHLSVPQFLGMLDERLTYSAGEKSLHDRFNDLSERVDKLTSLVEKIAAEILPKDNIDKSKPGLK